MKITEFKVRMVPSEGEDKAPVDLIRTENRMWIAESDGNIRGLFPSEVRLANDIQELIIHKFNGGN